MKKVFSTESVADFVARGGEVKVGSTKYARGSVTFKKLTTGPEVKRTRREEQPANEINMDLIPESLKISLGMK